MENKKTFKNHPLAIILNNKRFVIPILILSTEFRKLFKDILSFKDISSVIEFFKKNFIENKLFFLYLAVFILILFQIVYDFFVYKNTTFTINEKNISYTKKGFFVKKYKTTLIENISNINIESNFFQRIFKIVKISIDTDSTESLKQSDYELFVKEKDANFIKNLINSRKKENKNYKFQENINEIDDSYTIKSFSKKDVLRHILLSTSPIILIFQISIIFSNLFFDNIIKHSLSIFILVTIFYFLTFIVKKLNKVNNLTIVRKENEIDISYGFIKNEQFSIPINKIQSIESEKSFFAKIFKYKIYKINAVGVGNEKEESNILNLYLKDEKAKEYIKEVLKEFEETENFIAQDVAYIKYLSVVYFLFSIFYTLILIFFKFWWISIILDVLLIFILYIKSKYSYISVLKDRIVIKRGFFSTITKTIYYEKIDKIKIKQNILSKIFKIEKLILSFKGKLGRDEITTGYYKKNYFKEIILFYKNGEKNKAE